MTTRLQTFPPTHHLTPARPILPFEALTQIQTYLRLTADPAYSYLHPDCHFTEDGPRSNSSSVEGGIVLHQLRRVEKGLRGVVLGPELEGEGDGEGLGLDAGLGADAGVAEGGVGVVGMGAEEQQLRDGGAQNPARGNTGKELQANDDSAATPGAMSATINDTPIENYQEQLRDQGFGIKEDEIGDRSTGVASGPAARPPVVHATRPNSSKKRGFEEVDRDGTQPAGKDKEARKRAKKERDLEKRREEQRRRTLEGSRMANGDEHAANDVVEREGGHVLDETRELHDEAGPSSTFNAEKITSNPVTLGKVNGAPSSNTQPDGTDQPSQPGDKSSKREKKKKKRRRQSQAEEISNAQPEEVERLISPKTDSQPNQPSPDIKPPQLASKISSPTPNNSKKHKRKDKHKHKHKEPSDTKEVPPNPPTAASDETPQANGDTPSTSTFISTSAKKRKPSNDSPQPVQPPLRSPNREHPTVITHEKKRKRRKRDVEEEEERQPVSSDKAPSFMQPDGVVDTNKTADTASADGVHNTALDESLFSPGINERNKEVDEHKARRAERKREKRERRERRRREKMEREGKGEEDG